MLLVKDRINFEHLSIDEPVGNLRTMPNTGFIPSVEDIYSFKEDAIQVANIDNFSPKICIHEINKYKDLENKDFCNSYQSIFDMSTQYIIIYMYIGYTYRGHG